MSEGSGLAAGMRWALPLMLLASCAPPWPDPAAITQDRSGHETRAVSVPGPLAGFAGYYAGVWTPSPGGSCASLAPVPRDMLVETSFAASGVNYPLRGFVQLDGAASLSYGKASLVGQFGPNGFAGQADTGDGCGWLVKLVRQPPIGLPPGAGLPSAAGVVQREVPNDPGREASPLPGESVDP